jgi:hypothetical protein
MRTLRELAPLAACLLVSSPVRADDAGLRQEDLLQKIEDLEQRVRELEAGRVRGAGGSAPGGVADWTRFVRLGGSANAGYFGGERNSGFDPDSFQVWDARLFVDAHLGDEIQLGEWSLFRNVGFSFEWDLVRRGDLDNRVGELYADFQGLLGNGWSSFQVGRFQIPVGEAYLRYSRGYADKPFVSNSLGPWWWDEGLRGYGSDAEGRIGYVWSFSDGETPFNTDRSDDGQLTLKLFANPLPWLHLSVSGLRSGQVGSTTQAANGALWLGESWARAFGSGSGVDNYQDGAIVADGPNVLKQTWLAAGDAVVEVEDRFALWLAYGRYTIDSAGPSSYDRVLHYWIAELVLRGSWLSDVLRPVYLGLRANALGTFDDDEGYLLDVGRSGSLGYNMRSLAEYSAVLGWELNRNLRLRGEYTHRRIDVVDGVSQAIRAAAGDADSFAIEVGASF